MWKKFSAAALSTAVATPSQPPHDDRHDQHRRQVHDRQRHDRRDVLERVHDQRAQRDRHDRGDHARRVATADLSASRKPSGEDIDTVSVIPRRAAVAFDCVGRARSSSCAARAEGIAIVVKPQNARTLRRAAAPGCRSRARPTRRPQLAARGAAARLLRCGRSPRRARRRRVGGAEPVRLHRQLALLGAGARTRRAASACGSSRASRSPARRARPAGHCPGAGSAGCAGGGPANPARRQAKRCRRKPVDARDGIHQTQQKSPHAGQPARRLQPRRR